MKNSQLAVSVLTLGLLTTTGIAASATPADKSSQPTGTQLKQMARDAHTPEQYATLAQTYGQLQKTYNDKASEEKLEWERRSQITTSLYAKYPKPADSARNLYEYYAYKASEAGALATKYSQLASPAAK